MPLPPCIERPPDGRGCPNYTTRTRCEEHEHEAIKSRKISGGTTPDWARARKIALERPGYRCEVCGKTDDSRAAGDGGLQVHHLDGRGVRAETHDQEQLQVRCPPCHRLTPRGASVRRARAERR